MAEVVEDIFKEINDKTELGIILYRAYGKAYNEKQVNSAR